MTNINIDLNNGDCLELMKNIKGGSVDMILCDLPYGTTDCKWDTIIPFENLWNEYKRIIKDNGVIALFGSEPFSSNLRVSNLKMYRYDFIWKKTMPTLFQCANKRPMNKHENISIFYKKQPTYNPQFSGGIPYVRKSGDRKSSGFHTKDIIKKEIDNKGTRHPTTILEFANPNSKRLHPTQKPIDILEWLLKTFSNEGELILDNCMGSGSTGIACINTNRNFIGIEKDNTYFEIAKNRLNEHINKINN